MKIDAHQHFWKYSPEEYGWISEDMGPLKQDRLPQDLQGPLSENGFEGCVAVQARQSEAETDFLLELAAAHDLVKAVVGWTDLRSQGLEGRLQHYAGFPALKGFRHIVQDEPDDEFLLRRDFILGVKTLGKFNFTYDILVYERQLHAAVRFLDQFEAEQPFVLDHIGKPEMAGGPSRRWQNSIERLAQHPKVYCKVSGLVTEADWQNWKPEGFYPFLEIVLRAFGEDRLMVGSDWPVCLLAADSYAQVMEIVEGFFGSQAEAARAKIFGENAARFYGINQ